MTMPLFDDRDGRRAERARFNQVSPNRSKTPSWIAKAKVPEKGAPPDPPPAVPRPAALPQEVTILSQGENFAPDDLESEPGSAVVRVADVVAARPDPALVQAFELAVVELAEARARLFEKSSEDVVKLAIAIAERVIAREVRLDPNLVRGIVKEGLLALGTHERVVVRLGTAFVDVAEGIAVELARSNAATEVRIDESLGVSGCVVETEFGSVDESLEARLAAILDGVKSDSDRASEPGSRPNPGEDR